MLNYIISSSAAEFASSVIWTPMEVVKGRLQIAAEQKSMRKVISEIVAGPEGWKGLWRGYWMGIAVFLPYSVVWWTSYETAKTWLADRRQKNYESWKLQNESTAKPAMSIELGPWEYAAASASATTLAQTVSNFLDVLKTRQQLAVSSEIAALRPTDQKGILEVAVNLIKEVGIVRACFKGLHVRLMQALPSGVLSMVIVESLDPERNVGDVFEEEDQVDC